jgi:hypothetical protein
MDKVHKPSDSHCSLVVSCFERIKNPRKANFSKGLNKQKAIKTWGGGDEALSILPLALNRGKWLDECFGCIGPRYPLYRWRGEQIRLGNCGVEKNSFPYWESNPAQLRTLLFSFGLAVLDKFISYITFIVFQLHKVSWAWGQPCSLPPPPTGERTVGWWEEYYKKVIQSK